MLYLTGTEDSPSLYSHTRELIGDPFETGDGFSAPRPTFSPAAVKGKINLALDSLLDIARRLNVGWKFKTTYLTSVADQRDYALPADWVKVEQVELDQIGQDLSVTDVAQQQVVFYRASTLTRADEPWRRGLSADNVFYTRDNSLVLTPPPNAQSAGLNAIRLEYASSTPHMTGAGDEPPFPRPHHELICFRAAISLGVSRGFDVADLRFEERTRQVDFVRAMQDIAQQNGSQMRVAGRRRGPRARHTKFGQVRRFSGTAALREEPNG